LSLGDYKILAITSRLVYTVLSPLMQENKCLGESCGRINVTIDSPLFGHEIQVPEEEQLHAHGCVVHIHVPTLDKCVCEATALGEQPSGMAMTGKQF